MLIRTPQLVLNVRGSSSNLDGRMIPFFAGSDLHDSAPPRARNPVIFLARLGALAPPAIVRALLGLNVPGTSVPDTLQSTTHFLSVGYVDGSLAAGTEGAG